MSMYPHLKDLCLIFLDVGWSRLEDFKASRNMGKVEVYTRKDPSDWLLGGFVEDQEELAHILVGRNCSSLVTSDILVGARTREGCTRWPLVTRL